MFQSLPDCMCALLHLQTCSLGHRQSILSALCNGKMSKEKHKTVMTSIQNCCSPHYVYQQVTLTRLDNSACATVPPGRGSLEASVPCSSSKELLECTLVLKAIVWCLSRELSLHAVAYNRIRPIHTWQKPYYTMGRSSSLLL